MKFYPKREFHRMSSLFEKRSNFEKLNFQYYGWIAIPIEYYMPKTIEFEITRKKKQEIFPYFRYFSPLFYSTDQNVFTGIVQRNGRYGNRSRQWPLLLSSSNSVGNCLLNNKTAAPMIFAYSKFSTNQNRSYCSHWSALADDSVEKRIFLSSRQKIS